MTVDECKLVIKLSKALGSITGMREAFKDEGLNLKLVAFDGDEEGGTHEATMTLPADWADFVLTTIEARLRADLKALGIT